MGFNSGFEGLNICKSVGYGAFMATEFNKKKILEVTQPCVAIQKLQADVNHLTCLSALK